jgi:hypothetical protein
MSIFTSKKQKIKDQNSKSSELFDQISKLSTIEVGRISTMEKEHKSNVVVLGKEKSETTYNKVLTEAMAFKGQLPFAVRESVDGEVKSVKWVSKDAYLKAIDQVKNGTPQDNTITPKTSKLIIKPAPEPEKPKEVIIVNAELAKQIEEMKKDRQSAYVGMKDNPSDESLAKKFKHLASNLRKLQNEYIRQENNAGNARMMMGY